MVIHAEFALGIKYSSTSGRYALYVYRLSSLRIRFLVVMLGAGVAERSGLFATAMSASMSRAPKFSLTQL